MALMSIGIILLFVSFFLRNPDNTINRFNRIIRAIGTANGSTVQNEALLDWTLLPG